VVLTPRRAPPNPMTEIEHALEAGEFVPYYQPVVDIRTGQLRGAEVLVRWRKPDGTLILPGSFIPLMESSGLIRDLTHRLMEKVSAEAGAAIGRRPDLRISFNFAGKLFGEPTIVNDVRNIFVNSPIKFSQVFHGNPPDHRRLTGAGRAHCHRRCGHRSQRAFLHAQTRRRYHQD